jgi:hypothetical protein
VPLARDHLDVERQASQVAEAHAAERRAPAQQQVLLDYIRQEPVGRHRRVGRDAGLLAAGVAGAEGVGPRREARQPAQLARACQRLDTREAGGAGDQRGIGQQQERREGDDLGGDALALAAPDADATAAVGQREGEQAGGGLAQPAASSKALR